MPFEKLLTVMTTLRLDIHTYTTITLEKLITIVTEEIKTPLSRIIDPTICKTTRTDLIPVVITKLTEVGSLQYSAIHSTDMRVV